MSRYIFFIIFLTSTIVRSQVQLSTNNEQQIQMSLKILDEASIRLFENYNIENNTFNKNQDLNADGCIDRSELENLFSGGISSAVKPPAMSILESLVDPTPKPPFKISETNNESNLLVPPPTTFDLIDSNKNECISLVELKAALKL
jgi:Ca2+-binding EF-hand superfamily protein